MRRLLALALATAGMTAACGKDEAAAVKVVPGQRAGVVIEVSGTVTATRPGAAARVLAKGEAVSGDDVIETGADGSVLIELDHNHATFTLPAGKRQEVARSLAWSQPAVAARPVTTDEHSAAAGRPIERSTADTTASSNQPNAAAAEPEPAPAAAAPAPAAAVPAPPPPRRERGRGGKATVGSSPPPPPTTAAPAPKDTRAPADEGGGGSEPRAAAAPSESMPAPPPEQPTAPSALGVAVMVRVTGDLKDKDVAGFIADLRAACNLSYPAKGALVLTVAPDGRVVNVEGPARLTTCVTGMPADKRRLPAKPKGSKITLTFGG